MPDIARIQRELASGRRGRLAVLRLPQPRRDRLPRARPRLRQVHQPPLVLLDPGRRASRSSSARRSSRRSSTRCPARSACTSRGASCTTGSQAMLGAARQVAMQYSPTANIPYVSIVDGGTVDLVRSLGYEVVSSAGLVQTFEAVLDDAAYRSHLEAGERVQRIKDEAFALIGSELRAGPRRSPSTTSSSSSSGASARRGSPARASSRSSAPTSSRPTRTSSRRRPTRGRSARATRCSSTSGPSSTSRAPSSTTSPGAASSGTNPPAKYVEIFSVVRDARDAALEFVRERFAAGAPVYGWEVDDACRGGGGEGRLRRLLHPPHRPLDRRGGARQRRQHRQPRDARRARARAGHLLLDRAGHLPRGRDGGALGDRRLHHAGRARSRSAARDAAAT